MHWVDGAISIIGVETNLNMPDKGLRDIVGVGCCNSVMFRSDVSTFADIVPLRTTCADISIWVSAEAGDKSILERVVISVEVSSRVHELDAGSWTGEHTANVHRCNTSHSLR